MVRSGRHPGVHSQAVQLNVELSYARNLSLRVYDNGVGIDSHFIQGGTHGWGC
jgi:nitrate/nitrite-specific signal transduction histidine kinase